MGEWLRARRNYNMQDNRQVRLEKKAVKTVKLAYYSAHYEGWGLNSE